MTKLVALLAVSLSPALGERGRGLTSWCVILSLAVACLVGCQPQVMPKGTGATGKLVTVAEEQNLDFAYTLSTDQQRGFDFLHQPFQESVILPDNPTAAQKELAEKVEQRWDEVRFALLEGKNSQRLFYLGILDTNVGRIRFNLAVEYAPNHVRALIVLGDLGYYGDREVTLTEKGDLAIAGEADAPFYLRAEPTGIEMEAGGFQSVPDEKGRSPATLLGITLGAAAEEAPNRTVYSLPAGTASSDAAIRLRDALREGERVVIERIHFETYSQPLFQGKVIPLPELDASGKPIAPVIEKP